MSYSPLASCSTTVHITYLMLGNPIKYYLEPGWEPIYFTFWLCVSLKDKKVVSVLTKIQLQTIVTHRKSTVIKNYEQHDFIRSCKLAIFACNKTIISCVWRETRSSHFSKRFFLFTVQPKIWWFCSVQSGNFFSFSVIMIFSDLTIKQIRLEHQLAIILAFIRC